MDIDEEQRKLYHSHPNPNQYLWIHNNHYHQLYSGFVHDQNAKIKLQSQNLQSLFKIQSKLLKNGKKFEINSTFGTWNLLSNLNQPLLDNSSPPSFTQNLIEKPSLIFGACTNNLKAQWRLGLKQYKKFKYNPFISLQTPKDLNDLIVTLGLTHRSTHLNFLTKFTTSIINSAQFIHKIRVDYAKNQIYFGVSSEITPGFNCKISKSLIGYEMSPGNNFYLRFQAQNIAQLVKGKQTYQQIGIYYIRKLNDDLKFGLGVKSINSIQNFLNLTIEKQTPIHVKARIDSKLNLSITLKKIFNDHFALSYGVGTSNLFQKRWRLQTGMVLEYNS